MHKYVCVSVGKNISFSENFMYVPNEWSRCILAGKRLVLWKYEFNPYSRVPIVYQGFPIRFIVMGDCDKGTNLWFPTRSLTPYHSPPIERQTNLGNPASTFVYQGVRTLVFSENFVCAPNEWHRRMTSCWKPISFLEIRVYPL